jgi:hypothetical protein
MPVHHLRLFTRRALELGMFSEPQAVGSLLLPHGRQTYNRLKVRFSATLGEDPEIDMACVIVPVCTENWLRFSARLDDSAPEVSFERAIPQ